MKKLFGMKKLHGEFYWRRHESLPAEVFYGSDFQSFHFDNNLYVGCYDLYADQDQDELEAGFSVCVVASRTMPTDLNYINLSRSIRFF